MNLNSLKQKLFTSKFAMHFINTVKRYRDKQRLTSEVEAITKKHNLEDIEEQKKIIAEFNLIQEKKSSLSRKQREQIERKVSFMILNQIIEVH